MMYEDSGMVCDAAASIASLKVAFKASRPHAMYTIPRRLQDLERSNMQHVAHSNQTEELT